ncbi:type II toxin-antitoxin system HipA family toxin [Xanthomonas prunicola]|uniref:type II toxin-antitoxin system HipA family toxin n=1 Tax=Xanthomonas prunicola TaxID=2053930 RepID=UPI002078C860|nr:type II toxin-antitoxin system HipA family toxin [Xanthomonas prunicola]USJ02286.1 type II toxin-antitoxin system HipA family toxin [Xanthomonas prunicola]
MAELCVWMNGLRVARWREDVHGARLTYPSEWLHSPQARPLSLSLPLLPEGQSHRGDVVTHYFDNLLPDSTDIRRRMRERFKTDSAGTFDLLQAVGRDCVGAIQLLAIDAEPEHLRSIQSRALSDTEVAAVLRGVTAPLLPSQHGDNDDFRLSLAGAQEKTALLHHQHQWCVPLGSTPSTHIFKLPLGLVGNMRADMQAVENEWLCAQLLAAFGIPVAVTTMGRFQEQRALIVERFDRRLSPDGQWWMRLPQEDLCQAFGVSSSKKYENDGGPGIVAIMELLRQSSQPSDRETFFKAQILFWLIAATDGHAKNFSLMIEPGGRFRMTPLYDVLSVYPVLGRGAQQLDPHRAALAMAVVGKNRHRRLKDIRRRHWNDTARACGVRAGAEPWIEELMEQLESALDFVANTLPAEFPVPLADTVFSGMRETAKHLREMPSDR